MSDDTIRDKKCQQKRILCVGMCVLDIVTVCREYPLEDTDRRCVTGYWQRGGNASNNCTVLRQLGDDPPAVEFLGMMSTSPAFRFLHEDCKERGIVIDNCPSDAKDPPFSSIILSQASGTRTIIHNNPDFSILKAEHFSKLQLSNYTWIHFEGRNPDETGNMIQLIHAHNRKCKREDRITISLDWEKQNPQLIALAELVNFVFIGKDLALYMGWENMLEAVDGLMERLVLRGELEHVKPSIICAWGDEGACCGDAQGRHAILPAAKVKEVIDSLGAGDTFCAATIYALAVHKTNLPTAVNYGNIIAGYKLGVRGYDAIKDCKREPEVKNWRDYKRVEGKGV